MHFLQYVRTRHGQIRPAQATNVGQQLKLTEERRIHERIRLRRHGWANIILINF
jgi:hypothetical protein